ncbi:unnamed protein product, partial [Pylaiella littoralis]
QTPQEGGLPTTSEGAARTIRKLQQLDDKESSKGFDMQRKPGGCESEEERPMLVGSQRTRTRTRLHYAGHRRPPPPKTTLAAVIMLVVGTVMSLLGIWHVWKGDSSRGGHHLLIGGILFVPGSYASTNLLGAYLGWPGYDYSSIPSYDD